MSKRQRCARDEAMRGCCSDSVAWKTGAARLRLPWSGVHRHAPSSEQRATFSPGRTSTDRTRGDTAGPVPGGVLRLAGIIVGCLGPSDAHQDEANNSGFSPGVSRITGTVSGSLHSQHSDAYGSMTPGASSDFQESICRSCPQSIALGCGPVPTASRDEVRLTFGFSADGVDQRRR